MDILYRDDRVIVCIKPAGILSTDEPGGMPELLRTELGDENALVLSVHRLDRVVSGVMVYALTRRAASDLSRQIREGTFRKEYLAVVHGGPGEGAGELTDWLYRDRIARRTLIVPAETPGARQASLSYETISAADGMSLLRIRLHSGRTHQIRVQLAGRGMPIDGDRKYGASGDGCGIALMSHMVGFMHPRTGEAMRFIHDLPDIYPWDRFLTE